MPPLFSIVTVVRNNAAGLSETAKSIRSQTNQNFEWIVIDGQSTDDTVEVAKSFRPDILVSESDSGIYDAMNKGLNLASGDYINFMNSGDMFASGSSLETVAAIIAAANGAPPQIIMGSSMMGLPGGRQVFRPVKHPLRYIWHGLPALHQAIFFSTPLHRRHFYSDQYPVSADYASVAEMLTDGATWRTCKAALSINEIGGTSFSHQREAQQHRDVEHVQTHVLRASMPVRMISRLRRQLARLAIALLAPAH